RNSHFDNISSLPGASHKSPRGLHACLECKRRKIRCDGNKPCNRCQARRYHSPCVYEEQRPRVVPSKKEIERLSNKLEKCSNILRCFFPNHDVESLVLLSREELCNLLEKPSPQLTEQLPSPPLRTPNSQLFDLEQIPAQDAEWDEERRERDPLPAEADDVNALSLTLDRQTSYLGISSVRAAMLVMVHIQPQLQASLAFHQRNSTKRNIEEAFTTYNPAEATQELVPVRWTLKGQALIDAYFKGCHVFTPMLDEVTFRADYLSARRYDAPWLSLVNMVFAIGSIMATKSSDTDHFKYYEEAMKHLSLAALGSSCIETVQSLALLGGHYLHYINRPNMANAILGATIRMASALGLHREPANQGINNTAADEVRRRTWWSLFCLDTWTTTTMGRPSFGRCDPSIDIQPPQLIAEQEERDSAQHAGVMPLLENIKFCKIATKIQDMLAVASLWGTESRKKLDDMLVEWYENLPGLLHRTEKCAEPLHLSRCNLRWRYWNLRMLLYRPVLLAVASSDKNDPLAAEDAEAIATCQELANKIIQDIASGWTRHQMSGWNAVWLLYQASMIPLISILWQPNSPDVTEWKYQVTTILELFEEMEEWSLAARRSRDVVGLIYEASCHFIGQSEGSMLLEQFEASDLTQADIYAWSDGLKLDYIADMQNQDWQWDINTLLGS
ncbi:unnamed protein product, partial [Clonostachys byssicola]